MLLSIGIIKAQNKFDKTITVIIKDFSEACGDDPGDAVFCLTDEKGGKITERYSCGYDNETWRVEPKDLITKDWVLNTKYKGKKATLYCTKPTGGAGWLVEKVDFGTGASTAAAPSKIESDKDLDKYIGCYKFLTYSYTISKFPLNSLVPLSGGCVPLEKKLIGKYFIVKTPGKWCSDTSAVDIYKCPGMKGFIVPTDYTGVISNYGNILSVDDKGTINVQNYYIGEKLELGETLPSINKKFILRVDGKYDLKADNAVFIRQ